MALSIKQVSSGGNDAPRSPRKLLSTFVNPRQRPTFVKLRQQQSTSVLPVLKPFGKRPRSDSQSSDATVGSATLVRRLSQAISFKLFRRLSISTPSRPSSPSSPSTPCASDKPLSTHPLSSSKRESSETQERLSTLHQFPRSAWSDYSDSESGGEELRDRMLDFDEFDFESYEPVTGIRCELEDEEEMSLFDFEFDYENAHLPPPGPVPTIPLPPLPRHTRHASHEIPSRRPVTDFDGDFWPNLGANNRRWSV